MRPLRPEVRYPACTARCSPKSPRGPLRTEVTMDPRVVTPYLIAALVIWGIYRRMRRSFGRQRVRDGLMWLRVGILTLAVALIAVQTASDVDVLGILLAGVACGAVLGYF